MELAPGIPPATPLLENIMSRITIPAREAAPAASQPLLDAVEKSLGSIPNLFRLIALSPVALEAYLGQSGLLAKTLSVKTRERIALAVAQVNGCDYCLSAHTYLGLNLAGLDDEEIALNRNGHSNDPKADAAVSFAAKVARERGRVDNADVAALRAAGYDDSKIVEIVALVAESSFTNFLNNVVQTEVDFPAVSAADLAEVA